jgi:hypothetical protein
MLQEVTMSDQRASARPKTPLRLTRRGRVVVVLALVIVLLVLTAIAVQAPSGAANESATPATHEVIVVRPGDTLWSIAKDHAPGRDIRAVIHEIEELNGLASGRISAGQRLFLPAAD